MSQKDAPLQVIIGNPPYSVGQKSANDNAQNLAYPKLDGRIAATYAKGTDAANKNSLYDSYIKAFRWSTDRLDKSGGIVCFVSNGAWLDGNSADGFRRSLENEFTAIYIFNTRGNARTSGELRQKEAGNVFGGGSRTTISITLLVKNPAHTGKKATIHYHDIGDYLNREEKLALIKKFKSVVNAEMPWKQLIPNEHGDWINARNDAFSTFIPLGAKDDKLNKASFFVPFYSNGVKTQRDSWCYNSSKSVLEQNIKTSIDFYNEQRENFWNAKKEIPGLNAKEFISYNSTKFSWSDNPTNGVSTNKELKFDYESVCLSCRLPVFRTG